MGISRTSEACSSMQIRVQCPSKFRLSIDTKDLRSMNLGSKTRYLERYCSHYYKLGLHMSHDSKRAVLRVLFKIPRQFVNSRPALCCFVESFRAIALRPFPSLALRHHTISRRADFFGLQVAGVVSGLAVKIQYLLVSIGCSRAIQQVIQRLRSPKLENI